MQPPRRREVQPRGVPPYLQKHRRKSFQPRGFLCDPQSISKLRRLRDHQTCRIGLTERLHSQRIGKAGLAEDFRGSDPQHRGRFDFKSRFYERQHEASHGCRVAC